MRKKTYLDIVESWLWLFIDTMENGYLRPGNDSGIAPKGIKIIFDGYGEKEDRSENINILTFAIFANTKAKSTLILARTLYQLFGKI
jgi:hypothetical protein